MTGAALWNVTLLLYLVHYTVMYGLLPWRKLSESRF
jgi:hypothetical protein